MGKGYKREYQCYKCNDFFTLEEFNTETELCWGCQEYEDTGGWIDEEEFNEDDDLIKKK